MQSVENIERKQAKYSFTAGIFIRLSH